MRNRSWFSGKTFETVIRIIVPAAVLVCAAVSGQKLNTYADSWYTNSFEELKEEEGAWYCISDVYAPGIALRTGPSENYPLIRRFPYGTVFYAEEMQGVWAYTEIEGCTGWIHTGYCTLLDDDDEDEEAEEETVYGLYYISHPYEAGIALRETPSESGTLLSRFPYGTYFYAYEYSGVWARTRINGYDGWIHTNYCTLVSSVGDAGVSLGEYVISNPYEEGIALRNGPSTSCSLIRRFPYGTRFTAVEYYGVWAKTTINGYTGWIHTDYCTRVY